MITLERLILNTCGSIKNNKEEITSQKKLNFRRLQLLIIGIIMSFYSTNASNIILVNFEVSTLENSISKIYKIDDFLSQDSLKINSYSQKDIGIQPLSIKDTTSIYVEYLEVGKKENELIKLEKYYENYSGNTKTSRFHNNLYRVVISEIDRGNYTEINGELEYLSEGSSCLTLRIILPLKGKKWQWHSGLDESSLMITDSTYYDTVEASTLLPPDGAFNGKTLVDGGYGDPVGQGTMSYYPICAISIDEKGEGLGIDMFLPIVYRLKAAVTKGLIAEFDIATSPLSEKFPNRAFFKLNHFNFNSKWGMRAALKEYYTIQPESFEKRVTTEGVWLPFTALRSISNWEDFGFAYHETSWNSSDEKNGKSLPNILSDKETGVLSFQYTEPWDVQIPIQQKDLTYEELISDEMIPSEHMQYIINSATEDKNGLWQTRRLETPWFKSGWAVSITTNCDPDLKGYNRYQYVKKDEIIPAIKTNVDGIYFDSMEWNWHHDLNYRKEHFKDTDYPLTFSKNVALPAIWNFASEFEFMKKIADEMHLQGKLVMGNGHGWNPFAAANLDLFGAELSWYSSGAHNTKALDFKRAISFQKPIVFLLNEGLNDKAFTDFPFEGYEIYFEKLMAYGFFPSFFSTDASSDPYWKDSSKVENGRPFFKKYIPIIKQIAQAGWEPITGAVSDDNSIRVERFGEFGELFFTVRNNSNSTVQCIVSLELEELKIVDKYSAQEIMKNQPIKVENNKLYLTIPAQRTQVIQILK